MARFLSLDWDHQQLHLVAATVGGGAVRVQRAVVWQEEQNPTPANAEALGKLLQERLKEAKIAAAPVLISIGRERLILKDIRYPAVPEAEEAAVVRFQAVKELTDAAGDMVIDYLPAGDTGTGERRALVVAIKREILQTYQTLCKAAGLKLIGVTPRPFGATTCLQHVAGTTVLTPAPEPADATVAVLTVSDQWAEITVSRGDALLLARSVAVGAGLPGEVRRSLAVYAGQSGQAPVRALYLAGSAEHASLRERLQEMLGIPVHPLDPFAGSDKPELPPNHRGSFAGAVGLLHMQAEKRPLPINFVQPREPKPPADPHKRRTMAAAGLAAAVLIGGVAVCWAQLAERDSRIELLTKAKLDLEKQEKTLDEDAKRIKAIGEWVDTEINWLDEIYDLVDRFPDPNTVRLTNITAQQMPARGPKDKHVAKLSITGVMGDDTRPVDDLLTKTDGDGHYKVEPKEVKPNQGGVDRLRFRQQFTAKIEVEKVPPTQFKRRLPDLPKPAARPGADAMDMGGFGGFGGQP